MHLSGSHGNATEQSAKRIALGQRLFNDPELSADGKIRCASCHQPEKTYSDGRRVAIGVFERTGTRNTPSLAILGDAKDSSFFWDGRRTHLEQAVIDPLTNPMEMGLSSLREVTQKITNNAEYRKSFAEAFPHNGGNVSADDIAAALATYVRSLNLPASRYDRYSAQHDNSALNASAQMGLAIFRGKGGCADCHLLNGSPAMFTDHGYHRTGVGMDAVNAELPSLTEAIVQRSLRDEAIGNRVASREDEAQLGRFNVTRDPADIGLFRTPSLRSVASTAPYMHDGSIPTLEGAIDREIYYRGLQSGHPLNLSVEDRAALKAFLESL